MTDEFEIKHDEDGEYYEKDGNPALRMNRVILPMHEGETLQDQDDIIIWTKFNVLLQAVVECTAEFGHAGDATRQLRVVAQECVRRSMFETRATKGRDEVTDEQLLTWYEVLKQMLEGENRGEWERVGDTNREYTVIVKELLERGVQMPAQKVQLEALDVLGELVRPQAKQT